MNIATLEVETVVKAQNNFRHVFTMLFFEVEKALNHIKHDPKFKDIKIEQIGSEEKPQYFATGYDHKGDYINVSIFIQKVY